MFFFVWEVISHPPTNIWWNLLKRFGQYWETCIFVQGFASICKNSEYFGISEHMYMPNSSYLFFFQHMGKANQFKWNVQWKHFRILKQMDNGVEKWFSPPPPPLPYTHTSDILFFLNKQTMQSLWNAFLIKSSYKGFANFREKHFLKRFSFSFRLVTLVQTGSNFTSSNKDLIKFVQKVLSILRNMYFCPRFCNHFQKQWIRWHFW
jgi:hypothetical protein